MSGIEKSGDESPSEVHSQTQAASEVKVSFKDNVPYGELEFEVQEKCLGSGAFGRVYEAQWVTRHVKGR